MTWLGKKHKHPAVQGADKGLDQLKYEIANELGATLGGDRTARETYCGGYIDKTHGSVC